MTKRFSSRGLHSQKVGDVMVTAINDGIFQASFDLIAGLSQQDCEALERSAFRAVPPRMTMNTFLLHLDGHLALIDTGCGISMGPTLGKTVEHLAELGLHPEDIDTVLITHLHPDHANGLIDAAGAAVYPRAELVLHGAELDYFLDEDSPSRSPEETQEFFPGAKAAIAPYRDRIRTVRNGPVLPHVSAVLQPGHTPGQTAWLIDSQGEQIMIWGDIVHMPSIQLPAPHAGTVLDIDPALAITTRRRTLDMAVSTRLRVAGIHLDFPAFGHIEQAGEGYRFIPDVWMPEP